MSSVDEQRPPRVRVAAERVADLPRDDRAVLPQQSVDDTDRGWGERPTSNDERLLAERPPHWG